MSLDAVVVGSGPAGVSTASALLRRGRKVLMVDGGLRLETERHRVVEELAAKEPSNWPRQQLEYIKEGMEPGREGIPLKRLFGSDFPFRETDKFAQLACQNSDIKMSLALGGLSNVWGAGAVPFSADDISDWPLKIEALAPYYKECLEEMDLAAAQDDLAEEYPLYTDRFQQLRPSRQAAEFSADLVKNRARLKEQGIRFGVSRLAVKAQKNTGGPGCVYCGLCLYGCPYGFIYNSADVVQRLRGSDGFEYHPDVIVDRAEERGGCVTIQGRNRHTRQAIQYNARQVFLACGAIPTTAILMDSLDIWDRPVEMKDSQYFLCPVVRFHGTAGVESELLHTLAQLFIEVHDPKVSAKGIHLSVYTYNDLLLLALQKQAGPVGKLMPGIANSMARRLLIFGGYLHSNESPGLDYTLARAPDGTRKILLQGKESPASAEIFKRLKRKLFKNSGNLKAVPLLPMARRGLPGRGFHAGGTFPMAEKPGRLQSDVVGRPYGFSNLYVVDATVFPSIPAPNLTLSVMANARRIASAACES